MFKVGDKVNIKKAAWERCCQENNYVNKPNPSPQAIANILCDAPYQLIQLNFPIWWFRENELEPYTEQDLIPCKLIERKPMPMMSREELQIKQERMTKEDEEIFTAMNIMTQALKEELCVYCEGTNPMCSNCPTAKLMGDEQFNYLETITNLRKPDVIPEIKDPAIKKTREDLFSVYDITDPTGTLFATVSCPINNTVSFNIPFEDVSSLEINGEKYKVGDKLMCCCIYEVQQLRPVYHSETGLHWKEHSHNDINIRQIYSPLCLIHGRKLVNNQ